MDYNSIIRKYEGCAVPHRGVRDEIKYIVNCIVSSLQINDKRVNKILCESFKNYKFIKSIGISGNYCEIVFYDGDDVRNLEFKCYYFDEDYKKMLYTDNDLCGKNLQEVKSLKGTYRFSSLCHFATLYYLDEFRSSNIKAVTSLCVNIQGLTFFHSYIWDVDNDIIIDLARNIVMSKSSFDYLFVLEEINVFDYHEYKECESKLDFGNYYGLLILALNTLEKGDKKFVKNY